MTLGHFQSQVKCIWIPESFYSITLSCERSSWHTCSAWSHNFCLIVSHVLEIRIVV